MEQNSLVNPLCIILVKNGSKGDRLLFRYPYNKQDDSPTEKGKQNFTFPPAVSNNCQQGSPVSLESKDSLKKPKINNNNSSNPYSCARLKINDELFGHQNRLPQQPPTTPPAETKNLFSAWGSDMLGELSDKDLSNLLAVNSDLAERKFELKLNGVRFVGHPSLMYRPKDLRPTNSTFQSSVKLFHIVFCLNALASHSIVKCFYDLSKKLGIGLRHEEYRCDFLHNEMKKMISIHDQACAELEDLELDLDQDKLEKVFNEILAQSQLAQLMKKVYRDVCKSGLVKLRVNNWIHITFCLPHKIHTLPFRDKVPLVEPETIHKCLEAIRPYHAILLITKPEEIAAQLMIDSSTSINRFLQVYLPSKSLQIIAADADLTLSQTFEIASHLVYWAKAIVIYPLCESNVYVTAPNVPLKSKTLREAFSDAFPGLSISQTLADFSLPMPLGERISPILGGPYHRQTQLIQLVTWMLKHKLIIQLHTYILMVTYLDGHFSNGFLTGSMEPLEEDNKMFEPDEDDDADAANSVSDSFSETTGDEVGQSGTSLPDSNIKLTMNSININEQQQTPRKTREESVSDAEQTSANIDDEIIGEPLEKFKGTLSELTNETVKRALSMVRTQVTLQDIHMFAKLSRYFTGEFHLEEIMYRENLRRSQLMLLLDKFRDVLITAEREDADIDFFQPKPI